MEDKRLKQIIREELTRAEEAEAMERDLKPRVFDGEMVDSYARNGRPSPEEIEEEARDIEERAAQRQQFVTAENYRWIVDAVSSIEGLPPVAFMMLITAVVVFFTEITSNTPTALGEHLAGKFGLDHRFIDIDNPV